MSGNSSSLRNEHNTFEFSSELHNITLISYRLKFSFCNHHKRLIRTARWLAIEFCYRTSRYDVLSYMQDFGNAVLSSTSDQKLTADMSNDYNELQNLLQWSISKQLSSVILLKFPRKRSGIGRNLCCPRFTGLTHSRRILCACWNVMVAPCRLFDGLSQVYMKGEYL